MSEIMWHICISSIYTRDRVTVMAWSVAYGWIQMLREILIWHF